MYKFYLSINNNETVILLPYPPEEFSITSPQSNETFISTNGELNIPGNKGLRTISFSSKFPMRETVVSQNKSMLGFEFVNLIEDLRTRKIPFRLTITGAELSFAVTIDQFDYSVARGDFVRYDITFKEFRFI